jgi:hypothetical protein
MGIKPGPTRVILMMPRERDQALDSSVALNP